MYETYMSLASNEPIAPCPLVVNDKVYPLGNGSLMFVRPSCLAKNKCMKHWYAQAVPKCCDPLFASFSLNLNRSPYLHLLALMCPLNYPADACTLRLVVPGPYTCVLSQNRSERLRRRRLGSESCAC